VRIGRDDVEAYPVRFDEGDAILDRRRAEIQLAQQLVGLPFEDGARFQPGQERHGVFDAVAQAQP